MLDWLTGDTLNGIVVTITFFLSLVISRYLILRRERSQEAK